MSSGDCSVVGARSFSFASGVSVLVDSGLFGSTLFGSESVVFDWSLLGSTFCSLSESVLGSELSFAKSVLDFFSKATSVGIPETKILCFPSPKGV